MSPRGPAHVCHKGTVPPPRHGLSRSVPPASVSQGPVGACSAPPRVVSPSGGRCRRGQGHPPWSPSTAAPCVSLRQALGCCVAGLSPRPWGSRARSGSPPRSCHQTPPPPRPRLGGQRGRGGPRRQEPATARLGPLAGASRRALLPRALPAIPPRGADAGRQLARPSGPLRRPRLDHGLPPRLGPRPGPALGRPGRRRPPGRLLRGTLPPRRLPAREGGPVQGPPAAAPVSTGPGRGRVGGVGARPPPSPPWGLAPAAAMPRPPACSGAGPRVLHHVSPRAARWSAVPSAAAATARQAPGGPHAGALLGARAANPGVWRAWADALPSSRWPPSGPAGATHRGERTLGVRAGRCAWRGATGPWPGRACGSAPCDAPQTLRDVGAQGPERRAQANRLTARPAPAGQSRRGPKAESCARTRPTVAAGTAGGGPALPKRRAGAGGAKQAAKRERGRWPRRVSHPRPTPRGPASPSLAVGTACVSQPTRLRWAAAACIRGRCCPGDTALSGALAGMAHAPGARWRLAAAGSRPSSPVLPSWRLKGQQQKCAYFAVYGARNVRIS